MTSSWQLDTCVTESQAAVLAGTLPLHQCMAMQVLPEVLQQQARIDDPDAAHRKEVVK